LSTDESWQTDGMANPPPVNSYPGPYTKRKKNLIKAQQLLYMKKTIDHNLGTA